MKTEKTDFLKNFISVKNRFFKKTLFSRKSIFRENLFFPKIDFFVGKRFFLYSVFPRNPFSEKLWIRRFFRNTTVFHLCAGTLFCRNSGYDGYRDTHPPVRCPESAVALSRGRTRTGEVSGPDLVRYPDSGLRMSTVSPSPSTVRFGRVVRTKKFGGCRSVVPYVVV